MGLDSGHCGAYIFSNNGKISGKVCVADDHNFKSTDLPGFLVGCRELD